MTEIFGDKRIQEALNLLNEVAKEKRTELSQEIATKYGNLKAILEEMGERIKTESSEAYQMGREKAADTVREIDESVHRHPWRYIAAATIGTLLLGYLFGRSSKR